MAEWVEREYRPSHEECIVSLWLRSYAETRYGKERGAATPGPARDAFWAEQRCTVMALIEICGARIICDAADDDQVWAFACLTPACVHLAIAKKSVGPELGGAMLRRLLAGALGAPRILTHEIRDLRRCGIGGAETALWREDARALVPTIMGFYR